MASPWSYSHHLYSNFHMLWKAVHWYGHVLGREDGNVLRSALDIVVESQRKKGRPERTWMKQVEEESVKVGLRREDAL